MIRGYLLLLGLLCIWPEYALAGCIGSKPSVIGESCSTSSRDNRPSGGSLYPPGLLLRCIEKMFLAQQAQKPFAEGDGVLTIWLTMEQPVQYDWSHHDRRFALRLYEAPMDVFMVSMHRLAVQAATTYYASLRQRFIYKPFQPGTPDFHYDYGPSRKPERREFITFSELRGFDIGDVFEAMRRNWNLRIYFPQESSNLIFAAVKRFAADHPLRALRRKIVWELTIANQDIYVSSDDGPDFDHIYALPTGMDREKVFPLMRPPIWLQRAEKFAMIHG